MNDKIKAAIAKALGATMDQPISWDAVAGEVMALVGPKPLVWRESSTFKACYSGPYTVQHEHSGDVQVWCAGIDGVIFAECGSRAAMQAAAQSHADAAWWSQSMLADMIGGE